MSEEELNKFIDKIKDLNALVDSLDKVPGRRSELASCKSHEDVVELARAWGFQIGRRWGENNN